MVLWRTLLFKGNNSLNFLLLSKGGQGYFDFSFDGSEASGSFDGWEFANYSDMVLTKAREASKLFAEKSPLIFSEVSRGMI